MNRNGEIAVVDATGRERERYPSSYGAKLQLEDGAPVEGRPAASHEWDPFQTPILTDVAGIG